MSWKTAVFVRWDFFKLKVQFHPKSHSRMRRELYRMTLKSMLKAGFLLEKIVG